jgi:Outer membrane protein beta-barrel domain
MRRIVHAATVGAALALLATQPTRATAQQPAGGNAPGSFHVGYTDLGAVLAIGGYSGANLGVGGRFEHGFKQLPDMGNGVLGIEVGVDYWHWSCNYGQGDCGVSVIPISGTLNYHFHVDGSPQFDPFIGVGLGYESYSWTGCGSSCGASSGLYFTGRAGLRYFLTPGFALYADVGTGGGALHAGGTWKISGN